MLAKTTITTYNSCLSSIARDLNYHCDIGFYPDGTVWLDDYEKIYAVIKAKSDSIHSHGTYLFAVRYLMEVRDSTNQEALDFYKKKSQEIRFEIEKNYMTKKKTEKQNSNWMTMSELKEVLNGLELVIPKKIGNYNDYRNLIKFITLKIHLFMPLRRDLTNCKIFKNPTEEQLSDKTFNYIVLDTTKEQCYYLGNVFKGSKYYSQLKNMLSDSIYKDLIFYFDDLIRYGKENYLITDRNNNSFDKTNFTYFLNSIFKPYKKLISSTMLRNIVISDLYKLDQATQDKYTNLAKLCGHSAKTAFSYYTKVID